MGAELAKSLFEKSILCRCCQITPPFSPATRSVLQSLSSPHLSFLSFLPSPPLPSLGGWRPILLLWVTTNTWAREGLWLRQWTVTEAEWGALPHNSCGLGLGRAVVGACRRQLCASVSGGLVLLDRSLHPLHPLSLQSVRSLRPFGDLILSGSVSVDFSVFFFLRCSSPFIHCDAVTFQVNRSPTLTLTPLPGGGLPVSFSRRGGPLVPSQAARVTCCVQSGPARLSFPSVMFQPKFTLEERKKPSKTRSTWRAST